MRSVLLIFILFIQCSWLALSAQGKFEMSDKMKFRNISNKDGLSQRSVIAILQDRKGYMWFGTRDGLNKFDGTNMINYRHDSEDSHSLSHSYVTSIFEDNTANLWVGTNDGLNRYDVVHDQFIRYKFTPKANSISNNNIFDMAQLEDDVLWVATNDGINLIDIKTNKIKVLKHIKNDPNSLSGNNLRNLMSFKNRMWICTVASIDVYNPENNTFRHYQYPRGVESGRPENGSAALAYDRDGNVWLGYENGLAKYDKTSDSFIDFNLKTDKAITSPVRSIREDYSGNLWVGTYAGLYLLNVENKTLQHIVHDENNPRSLSQNSIYKIIMDSRGDTWIGTWVGGINYFDKDADTFKQFSAGDNDKMMNHPVASSIVEDQNGNYWIGTEGGGINFYNKGKNKFTYFVNDPEDVTSLSSNNVKAIIRDHAGNFWIGTHQGGLDLLNPNVLPLRFRHFSNQTDTSNALFGQRILTLFEDHNYNIWIGTITDGLILFDRKTEQLTKLDGTYKAVESIVQDVDPDYLLAGGSDGIEKINIHTKVRTKIQYRKKAYDNASLVKVNCIHVDANNTYWIGTEGQGLFHYDPVSGARKQYGINQGLPNEVIYGILLDDSMNIWISSNRGLSRLDKVTNEIINFDQSDGLNGDEFNYGAYAKMSDATLMFGGSNGLNYFDPKAISTNKFIPPVEIFNIDVSNKPYLKISDSVSQVVLSYDQNDFSIDYTALSFSQPRKNMYAYMLEGYDQDWIHIGNNKRATYTNIDAGHYIFRVKAANNDGVWNEDGDALEIIIFPAPWRTWWAYLVYVIIISGILFYISLLIKARVSAKNELRQEKIDKERIEHINQMKLELFTNISHDFRTPLTLILGPIESLLKIGGFNVEVKKSLGIIERNIYTLQQLINEFLDFRKSESGKHILSASKNDIVSFTLECKLAFAALAVNRNIDFSITQTEKIIEVWFDRMKYKKVLINLLSNAFKFTPDNSQIAIAISKTHDNQNVQIDITNKGKVISPDKIAFVFDRFYQLEQKDNLWGTGIGLALVKNLVELHHGKIVVTSTENSGTCFTLLLPLGCDHFNADELIEDDKNLLFTDEQDIPIVIPAKNSADFERREDEDLNTSFNNKLPTLLIVEDNDEVRDYIEMIFGDGYNLLTAVNGKQGFALAQKYMVDLIVSDVMMPEMNGFEFCEKIKSEFLTSHIPVILLTAKTADAHQHTGYQIGADAYITKPFSAETLVIRVRNFLETRKKLITKFKRELILEPEKLDITSADEQFLTKAIRIVENSISKAEFDASDFTSEMSMSRTVLYNKLKALTGQSLSAFIRNVRLKRAAQLMIQTEMNISEIAYTVGFNDLKYFRKSFKELFKILPSDYRIASAENNTDTDILNND